jgi:hypothetical protein
MAPIDDAIAAMESHDPGERFVIQEYANKFGVNRSTLSRRWRGQTTSVDVKNSNQQKLSLHQESKLIEYIGDLTKRGLAPTRTMIQTFASEVAEQKVSDAWVTRFLNRNHDHLISKWTTGIDRLRHKADSWYKYMKYFELLHAKMKEYHILPDNTYNMDEKGFMIGATGRSKRVFTKGQWERKEVRDTLQDGSREWITVLAAICATGEWLPPSLVYSSASCTLQSSWVADIEVGKHDVFVASSPSGWTNQDVGLGWLEQVFERCTKQKARRGRDWRLLIVDGHGSHLTQAFIEYCIDHRILLAVFPPHSTHTLQPLDVVMFKPLSTSYHLSLISHLQKSQGLVPLKKGDFFPLFWDAWVSSFKKDLILKAFSATGIWPMDPKVILHRFTREEPPEAHRTAPQPSNNNWQQMERLIRFCMKDYTSPESKQLSSTIHEYQVYNHLLYLENKGLREALTAKKKHKKGKVLDLQQRQEFHAGTVLWTPRKLREGKARDKVKEREEQELQLQKAEAKELKAAAMLYKQKIQEEKRVAREKAKVVREKEKAEKAAERARKIEAQNTQKALQLAQRSKRKASQGPSSKNKRQKQRGGGVVIAEVQPELSAQPPKVTSRGRNVYLPQKFK